MARIKSEQDIEILREGGKRLAWVLREITSAVKPGVSALELDALAERLMREGGDVPSFLNYRPDGASLAFPASLCVSINDEVVHGIPGSRVLEEGDIVSLDAGLEHRGRFVDMAVTVPVGVVDEAALALIETCRTALSRGIASMHAGGRIGDIGHAIEKLVRPRGYGIVRELGGHGVGHEVHETPYVPNYGERNTGEKLLAGMVLAIEPMINEGSSAIKLAPNRFTYATKDGKRSAHFEHTVLVTERGSEILTI